MVVDYLLRTKSSNVSKIVMTSCMGRRLVTNQAGICNLFWLQVGLDFLKTDIMPVAISFWWTRVKICVWCTRIRFSWTLSSPSCVRFSVNPLVMIYNIDLITKLPNVPIILYLLYIYRKIARALQREIKGNWLMKKWRRGQKIPQSWYDQALVRHFFLSFFWEEMSFLHLRHREQLIFTCAAATKSPQI
jgi:hypothetical protein